MDKDQFHHITRVLKTGRDDTIEIIIPGEHILIAKIQHVGKRQLEIAPVQTVALPPNPRPNIHLFQALPKQDKLTEIIRAAVECGVSRIIPCETDRSVPRVSDIKPAKVKRWTATAQSAAIQSQQYRMPSIEEPSALGDLGTLPGTVILPWEDAPTTSTIRALFASSPTLPEDLSLIIGPEGGFDAKEVQEMQKKGAHVVSLGDTVLRVEHAALYAIAQIKAEYNA